MDRNDLMNDYYIQMYAKHSEVAVRYEQKIQVYGDLFKLQDD